MLPTQDTNLCGTRVKPVTDLGLAMSVINGAAVTSTAFSTGLPGSVVVLVQSTTGAGTIDVNVDATAALAVSGLGSPDATITLTAAGSGAKQYAIVETSDSAFADALDPSPLTDTSSLWVALKETASSGNFLLTAFSILVLFELRGGEDWYSIRHGGINSVGGTVGQSALAGVNNTTYVAGYQDGAGNLYFTET